MTTPIQTPEWMREAVRAIPQLAEADKRWGIGSIDEIAAIIAKHCPQQPEAVRELIEAASPLAQYIEEHGDTNLRAVSVNFRGALKRAEQCAPAGVNERLLLACQAAYAWMTDAPDKGGETWTRNELRDAIKLAAESQPG